MQVRAARKAQRTQQGSARLSCGKASWAPRLLGSVGEGSDDKKVWSGGKRVTCLHSVRLCLVLLVRLLKLQQRLQLEASAREMNQTNAHIAA